MKSNVTMKIAKNRFWNQWWVAYELPTLAWACVFLLLLAVSCKSDSKDELVVAKVYVPEAPSYTDAHMWYIEQNDRGQGADVFYIPSTREFDWYTPDCVISHWAAPSLPLHREHMMTEMTEVAQYMADGNNFYSPYYRHITLNTWATLNEDTIRRRYEAVAWKDVKNAFAHYLTHYHQGRPFILAGFSQGGKSVVELLKTLPEKHRAQLIAAYVLGYKVTPDDVQKAPWIKAAQGATDTGVTICYNSVSDVKYLKSVISAPNVMCINPVNWKTDATPATLHDTITVTLSPEHKVLVLKGFDGSYLPNILNILNVGDYHGIEPWVYSENLRQNIQQRIRAHRQPTK